jgi:hypothetical protein
MKSHQNDGATTDRSASSLVSCLCIVIMLLCAIWNLVAPWFTAHNIIYLNTERYSCWLAIFGVLIFGAGALYSRSKVGSDWKFKVYVFLLFFGLCLTFYGFAFATDLFFYWKIKAIPPAVWAQMASDLRKLGEAAIQNHHGGSIELPESFHLLGHYGYLNPEQISTSSGGDDLTVDLAFGNKLRGWGLFVSSDKVSRERFNTICVTSTMVAPDAMFYIRPED